MNSFASLKAVLRNWPQDPVPAVVFLEHPHERLRKTLLKLGQAGTADIASLVRHVLQFEQMHHGGVQKLTLPMTNPWPSAKDWKAHGCRVREVNGSFEVEAEAWEPMWLTLLHRGSDQQGKTNPFTAVEAEEIRHPRLSGPEAWQLKADPALSAAFTGFTHYLSAAQAETVRAVML